MIKYICWFFGKRRKIKKALKLAAEMGALFDGGQLASKYDTACRIFADVEEIAEEVPEIFKQVKRDFDMIETQYIRLDENGE